jgi:hypothetical protein
MLLLLPLLAPPAARAAPRELVMANENLAEAGSELEANFERFLRRIEQVTGWPKQSLKGRALVRPSEALDYIRKHRVGFAILPIHQLAEGSKALKLELLARAVSPEGTELYHAGVARHPKGFAQLGADASIKVAGPEVRDAAWLTIISDDTITEDRPATLIEVPSSEAALQALVDKKVDVAIVSNTMWQALEKRATGPKPEFDFVFASPRLPPSAVVAVGKFASAADRKKLAAALHKVCREDGGPICGRVGLMYIQPGETQSQQKIIQYYQTLTR